MSRVFRRIVTATNAAGKSVVARDERIEPSEIGFVELWQTEAMPAPLGADSDPRRGPIRLEPPANGTKFRFFTLPPVDPAMTAAQVEALVAQLFAAIGASHARVDTARHPVMHKTRSIDYIMLLEGQVSLLLDTGEELPLAPFDVVIQRGTNHSWINRGSGPALMMAVLIDGAL